jgi:hypothetical protein
LLGHVRAEKITERKATVHVHRGLRSFFNHRLHNTIILISTGLDDDDDDDDDATVEGRRMLEEKSLLGADGIQRPVGGMYHVTDIILVS